MAQPVATPFDNGSTTTNASSYATTSKTFVVGRLYLIQISATGTNVVTPTSVTMTVGGQAWTLIIASPSGSAVGQICTYAIIAPAVTDTVTISYGAQAITGFEWIIDEVTQFNPLSLAAAVPTAKAATASGTSATPSASLTSAPAADSLTIGYAGGPNAAFTAGAQFTKLTETAGHSAPAVRSANEVDKGIPQTVCDWSITSGSWQAMAIEVTAAPTLLPKQFQPIPFISQRW